MTDPITPADSRNSPDFRLIFESLPNQYIVVDPQRRVVAATDSFLAATRKQRNAVLGRDILLVFPDNPNDPTANGTTVLRESIERVVATREADILPVQRYDMELPDGSYEERYWQPLNAPVFDGNGEVTCIIHGAEDVTAQELRN